MNKETVRNLFAQYGVSIAEWARREGFSAPLVYQILAGSRTCVRGQSHEIAVRLGIKRGAVGGAQALDQSLERATRELATPDDRRA